MTHRGHNWQSWRPAAAGFTLLEILVVLSIASLLLTLVPLAFSGSVDLVRSKGAARELAATLQSARGRAVARNRIVDVTLDADAGRYVNSASGDERVLPKGVRLTLVDVDRHDTDSEQGRIRFFPDGSSSGGKLLLEDGTRRFTIAVHWLLGRVDVSQDSVS
ncbi:MAG: GspH/FimT family pseudopilin [Gammaproteobacteria bacterium]|nr:GspH/FimT family pseudopilin [Gammaproteobacteria bacterium]